MKIFNKDFLILKNYELRKLNHSQIPILEFLKWCMTLYILDKNLEMDKMLIWLFSLTKWKFGKDIFQISIFPIQLIITINLLQKIMIKIIRESIANLKEGLLQLNQ